MNAKTDRKIKKKVTGHLHGRIKKLADAAIDRGDIIKCDRQPNDSYILTQSCDKIPTIYTAVGAATLLYLMNSLAQAQAQSE